MATAANALIQVEQGQSAHAKEALTKVNATVYKHSAADLWSKYGGVAPDIKPNGVISGGLPAVAASGSNDVIDVTAVSIYLAGISVSVAAQTDTSITRPSGTAGANFITYSLTVTSGGAFAVVAGTEFTAASEVRGAAGGPPWIPTGSVELGQVRLTSATPAPITAAEFKTISNNHREIYNAPGWDIYALGDADTEYAFLQYASEPMANHSDDAGTTTAAKKCYATVYEPVLVTHSLATDFVPARKSWSTSSTPVYDDRTVNSASSSVGQATFTAYLNDGLTDALVITSADNICVVKYFQDKLKTPYNIMQGYLGVSITNPASDSISAACTISPENAGLNRAG